MGEKDNLIYLVNSAGGKAEGNEKGFMVEGLGPRSKMTQICLLEMSNEKIKSHYALTRNDGYVKIRKSKIGRDWLNPFNFGEVISINIIDGKIYKMLPDFGDIKRFFDKTFSFNSPVMGIEGYLARHN